MRTSTSTCWKNLLKKEAELFRSSNHWLERLSRHWNKDFFQDLWRLFSFLWEKGLGGDWSIRHWAAETHWDLATVIKWDWLCSGQVSVFVFSWFSRMNQTVGYLQLLSLPVHLKAWIKVQNPCAPSCIGHTRSVVPRQTPCSAPCCCVGSVGGLLSLWATVVVKHEALWWIAGPESGRAT